MSISTPTAICGSGRATWSQQVGKGLGISSSDRQDFLRASRLDISYCVRVTDIHIGNGVFIPNLNYNSRYNDKTYARVSSESLDSVILDYLTAKC